ncbi:hypothetical protein FQZ97_917610 [compost metagenome]
MLAIEHHAAGALEEQPLSLHLSKVQYSLDPVILQLVFQYALSAFEPTVVPLHGVERQSAVGMAAPPVVGEDRVRRMGRFAVLGHQHLHTLFAQGRDVTIKLFQGTYLGLFRRQNSLLEPVVAGGIQVEGKTGGPNHQDGIGGLHGDRFVGWMLGPILPSMPLQTRLIWPVQATRNAETGRSTADSAAAFRAVPDRVQQPCPPLGRAQRKLSPTHP